MPYSVTSVANYFAKKGIEEGLPLTQMKLQKVVYFAHGLHLAKGLGPLINENFQAWKFGPVVPSLYHSFRLFGSSPIDDTVLLEWIVGDNAESINKSSEEVINSTWDSLKNIDALQLSAWTHIKNSPWSEYYRADTPNIEIPNRVIESYFKEKFMKAAA